jgi:ssDNA-binding Zn-finger/Zn-ribbon topoisomerase 1
MSDSWKKHDRPCEPCPDCGTELYEKFWGNGGWVRTEKATDKTHHESDCVRVLKAKLGYFADLAGQHRCQSCGKMTRDSTAGCDHRDLEDK